MATILEFGSLPRPTTPSAFAATGASASAEIVLFPGVRYEREPEKAESKPKRGKHRRDTLELEG
jgi:hypothetical protein